MRKVILVLLEVLEAMFLLSNLYQPTTTWGYNLKATIVLLGMISLIIEVAWWSIRRVKGKKGFGIERAK
ncbi:hypothetical protein [Lactobacillus sp. PSON]|uniref:hypothetical protein n=1 Tax=Lactobacillus sp. PSON TaxID=3455454 RepID=UPI0040416AC8